MVTELQGRGVDGGYLAAFSHRSSLQFGRFFFRFLSFLFSVVSVVEKVVAQRVLELDKQVLNGQLDMVDGRAHGGGGGD